MLQQVAANRWSRYCTVFVLLIGFALVSSIPTVASPSADTSPTHSTLHPNGPSAPLDVLVILKVVIENVRATNNFDGPFDWDRADFYAQVRILGACSESPVVSNQDNISPNWEFSEPVSVADFERGVISVAIEIFDADDFHNRNIADIASGSDKGLLLEVDANKCVMPGTAGSVSGTVTGSCGAILTSEGADGQNTAEIFFRIEAELPTSAPGLHVRCIHDPIWPQAGDTVTVRAEALNDALATHTADEVEVWFGSTTAPIQTCTEAGVCSATQTAPSSGGSMFYGCQVRSELGRAWSGWKRVQVGTPTVGRAVPILFTGPSSGSADIVFVPDRIDFTNANDPDFLQAVSRVIGDAYYGRAHLLDPSARYGERLFLDLQDKFNFWIATDEGAANGHPRPDCVVAPGNWGSAYSFADTAAVLHTRTLRDCAIPNQRVFSTEPHQSRTVLHETAHSPFGLADEKCCVGGYFETDSDPNIYVNLDRCHGDVIALQAWDILLGHVPRTSSACRRLEDNFGNPTLDPFFTSESAASDLMLNGGRLNGADVRRIEGWFDECRRGACGADAAAAGAVEGSPADPVPDFDAEETTKSVLVQVDFEGRRRGKRSFGCSELRASTCEFRQPTYVAGRYLPLYRWRGSPDGPVQRMAPFAHARYIGNTVRA